MEPFIHFEPTKPLELFFFAYPLLNALLKRQTSEANIS
jgi:hypothetical protein